MADDFEVVLLLKAFYCTSTYTHTHTHTHTYVYKVCLCVYENWMRKKGNTKQGRKLCGKIWLISNPFFLGAKCVLTSFNTYILIKYLFWFFQLGKHEITSLSFLSLSLPLSLTLPPNTVPIFGKRIAKGFA